MPILSLLRKGKEGKGVGQLPVQHQLSETFNGGETPLPVHFAEAHYQPLLEKDASAAGPWRR